uniref:Uncharacterized protein n=1 Tax=Anguilla anguilla TaxID=7936 RepID=A0A0E9U8J6_ANGAN
MLFMQFKIVCTSLFECYQSIFLGYLGFEADPLRVQYRIASINQILFV